jgi:hypothetical protein
MFVGLPFGFPFPWANLPLNSWVCYKASIALRNARRVVLSGVGWGRGSLGITRVVPRLRRSESRSFGVPALPGWAMFSGRPSGPRLCGTPHIAGSGLRFGGPGPGRTAGPSTSLRLGSTARRDRRDDTLVWGGRLLRKFRPSAWFLMTQRGGRVSIGDWLLGSQVSKARPGAPFDCCKRSERSIWSPDSPQRVGCSG